MTPDTELAPREEYCDVVIVGSRLAGACAAAHFAKAGLRVVALDRSRFPSDQLSTHLLFPNGIRELERMGALEGILAKNPARSPWLSLNVGDDITVNERWRANGDIDYCMCVPRLLQDLELVKAARAAGADVREKHKVADVLWRGGRASGVRFTDADGNAGILHAKLVIGADGRRSSVAAAVGAWAPYRASRNGRALIFRYADDPRVGTRDGETIFQWRDEDSFAFVFPSAPVGKALCLFMGPVEEVARARKDPEGYWAGKLVQHPGMAKQVAGFTNLTPLRSTGETTAFFRASSGPGWALLGDAGHFKDPVIGQGQRDALWTGRAIAEATAHLLDEPAALDAALRRWEAERDGECLHAYHLGNLETEIRPVSPALTELLRRASDRGESPDIGDLFGRARTMPDVVTVPRMVAAAAQAFRRGTGASPRPTMLRDAVQELRVHLRVRQEIRAGRFRSTRLINGSEWPDAQPPAYRATGGGAGTSAPKDTVDVLASTKTKEIAA
ncbi:MAG TPA: FAD-dependent monooxygenase [Sporichthya sp.]|nr:FAD-dependent monooxygenase [Sporichthya sp.]